jgi:hypothetical protein
VVTILNQGMNTLTSCTIQYQLNGGTVNSFPWTGSIAQGQAQNVTLPALNLATGSNSFSVSIVNPNNGIDENLSNNTTVVTSNLIDVGPVNVVPYLNDLASSNFPYAGWQINNPDASTTWASTNVTNGGGVLKYDCYNYNAEGEEDEFITVPFSLADFTSFSLKFKVAHRRYNNNYTDGLKVSVGINCDGPWTEVYNKSGAALATTTNLTQDYLNPSASEWRQECVDLGVFASSNIFVKFTGVNGYGNNIFVDDIEIVNADCQGTVGIQELGSPLSLNLIPNPSNGNSVLEMSASDVGAVNIEIYNILGEKVMCLQDNVSTSGKINVSLNGSALPSGVYIVKAIMKSSQTIVRWDIKR